MKKRILTMMGFLFLFIFVLSATLAVTTDSALAGVCCGPNAYPYWGWGHWYGGSCHCSMAPGCEQGDMSAQCYGCLHFCQV